MKYSKDYIKNVHQYSSSHKDEIMAANLCGCFYCKKTFSPSEIEEWIEENSIGEYTAICPRCGIDSVLSDRHPIFDKNFLSKMNNYWF